MTFYRQSSFMYRGYGQCRTQITPEELKASQTLDINKQTFAMTREVSQFGYSAMSGGAPYEWPHMLPKPGINVSYSDGHATWEDLGMAEYNRTLRAWTWDDADAYEALMWIGLETNDLSRLRTAFP